MVGKYNKTEKAQSKTARQVCDRENMIWINLVYTLWIPGISWTIIGFHYFRGHAAVISTNFVDKHWIPLFSWTRYNDFHYFLEKPASSAVNVHFFRGIQKSFPIRTTRTTTTNRPFLRPRQRSLVVKKEFRSFKDLSKNSCRQCKKGILMLESIEYYLINIFLLKVI